MLIRRQAWHQTINCDPRGVYQGNQKSSIIEQALPKAWSKLIEEPDELLVDLLAEAVEHSCGLRPDNEQVARFSASSVQRPSSGDTPLPHRRPPMVPNPFSQSVSHSVTNTSLDGITWRGHRIAVHSWIEGLGAILQHLQSEHQSDMNKCLSLRGRKRPYFSKNQHELRQPRQLDGTPLFYESNLSAQQIRRIADNLLIIFGYPSDTVSFDYER